MMVLVIGGSGSGKSAYAEELACALARKEHTIKYYLATMQASDEEGRRKVERHRALRSGKGFITIEQPVQIADAFLQMGDGKKTVLLECVSNLAANEMFTEVQTKKEEEVAAGIIRGIEQLKEKVTHLVVVSNNVFEDGVVYDPTVIAYLDALGMINCQITAWADEVIEVVAGIPILIKHGSVNRELPGAVPVQ